MSKFLYLPLLIAVLILLRFIIFFVTKRFHITKSDFALISLKDIFLEWVIVSFLITSFFAVMSLFTEWGAPTIVITIIGIFSASAIISYNFIVQPILSSFSKNKFKEAPVYENWIKTNFNYSVKVRIIEENMINAYATGVVPFSKLILLGAPIIKNMTDEEIKGLLSHEVGHSVKNHLFILFILNILVCGLHVISSSQFFPLFEQWNYTGMWVAFHGGFWGGITVIVTALGQRKLEKSADLFAAKAISSKNYAAVLTKLNQLTDGGLSRKSISYPTLIQRIKHIRKHHG